VLFLRKCFGPPQKKHGWGQRKKKEGTSSAIFGVGTRPNALSLSNMPTAFVAEHNKDEVLEGKFLI